jgi:CTP synthase (UTP-ammonia lyase)
MAGNWEVKFERLRVTSQNQSTDMKLAIIGDFNPSSPTHMATNDGIAHSTKMMGVNLMREWVPTDAIADNFDAVVSTYDGFWIAPGSPYKSMDSALRIIEYTRLNNIPTFGTCGGFQHMAIEFARNVLGVKDAEHAEYDPYASKLVVTPLSCSLRGKTLTIMITDKSSLVYRTLGTDSIEERYYCNFGLNPEYQAAIDAAGFKIVGTDADKEARILELQGHRFFIGTLFVPQANSSFEKPHPLVTAFIAAVCRVNNM